MKVTEKSHSAPALLTFAAGCNQLINWGISFYMPGTFARAIAQDTGWSAAQIYLGLTLAMLMMAMVSPFVARLLTRIGGQRVVVSGTLIIAGGCLTMANAHTLPVWFSAWLLTGVGMRLALYDALFAALVNLYGQRSRVTLSRVTLAGGLASAVFWPLGASLLTTIGWRHALQVYALFGVLSALLLWTMPFSGGGFRFRINAAQADAAHDISDAAVLCARPERPLFSVGRRRVCAGIWRH